MNPLDTPFIVGIDLGTTNSAVAYADLRTAGDQRPAIRILKIPQLTGLGEVSALEVLPSFMYLTGEYDLQRGATALPWQTDAREIVGQFAHEQGARIPSRLVSSAKSWLCHGQVDRRARILPWGSPDDVPKVSPVSATAAFLRHMKNAWNNQWPHDPEFYLENQTVVLTVPASFDEVARDLTLEAAAMAGLTHVTLLEEPLAAFYSWLTRHEGDWKRFIQPDDLILVCDVGGGTTDFSLIALQEREGALRFERIAVGEHLILGGDNADLALARKIEQSWTAGRQPLGTDRFQALCHQCRKAKESLLDGRSASVRITLTGEGRQLIAGTLTADLDTDQVIEVVAEGFFPLVVSDNDSPPARQGIAEFGLPYAQEPAVTRHLTRFLMRHSQDVARVLKKTSYVPDWLLFNGGALKPHIIQERLRETICRRFELTAGAQPKILDNRSPELAVAWGAAYYGLVKAGKGVRVGSGSPRAYYMGVGREKGCDGERAESRAVCIVERGLEEGGRIKLDELNFKVRTNQPVSFDLYASSFRTGDRTGDFIRVDDSLTALPAIQTIVQFGKKGGRSRIPVSIEACYTEIGTLAVWCRSKISSHRWKLQFQLRDRGGQAGVSDPAVFEEQAVQKARDVVAHAFENRHLQAGGGKRDRTFDTLFRDVDKTVGCAREKWPLAFIRSLCDDLIGLADARKRSPTAEARWLNITGFCLRPGFGDGFDVNRNQALWKIYRQGPIHGNSAQVRSEWWILWRRVAGGLRYGQQKQFLQDITPLLAGKKGSRLRVAPQEMLEIWMAAASMEQLLVKDKLWLGQKLLADMRPKKSKPQHFWSLARIGARELFYGPADRVVPPGQVAQWLERLMDIRWRNPRPVFSTLCQLGRRTGDRARDLDTQSIQRIMDWMTQNRASEAQLAPLREITPVQRAEQQMIFGDSLPAGLLLGNDPEAAPAGPDDTGAKGAQ